MTTMESNSDPNQNTNRPTDEPVDAGAADQGARPDRSAVETRLHRLQHLLRRRHHEQHGPHGAGRLGDATRGRGRVIAALQMQSPIPTRELAYLLDIRQQSLNELLKKLEGDGLVERTAYPEVPPRVEYALTARGDELMARMMPLMEWIAHNASEIVAR